MAHLAEPLMRKGGTLFTITLRQPNGGEELQHHGRRQSGAGSAVCYLAAEFGPKGIRVHTSPGPLATRAASGIPEFDELLDKARAKAPIAQPRQHRRCPRRHRASGVRRDTPHHRRDPLHHGGYHIID